MCYFIGLSSVLFYMQKKNLEWVDVSTWLVLYAIANLEANITFQLKHLICKNDKLISGWLSLQNQSVGDKNKGYILVDQHD